MKIQYDSSIKDDKRARFENEVSDFYEIYLAVYKRKVPIYNYGIQAKVLGE